MLSSAVGTADEVPPKTIRTARCRVVFESGHHQTIRLAGAARRSSNSSKGTPGLRTRTSCGFVTMDMRSQRRWESFRGVRPRASDRLGAQWKWSRRLPAMCPRVWGAELIHWAPTCAIRRAVRRSRLNSDTPWLSKNRAFRVSCPPVARLSRAKRVRLRLRGVSDLDCRRQGKAETWRQTQATPPRRRTRLS